MRRLLFLWTLAIPVLAQTSELDSNTLTITASRTFNIVPDQALIWVGVGSTQVLTPDTAAAFLQGSGITADNLTGVSSGIGGTTWYFSLAVPWSNLKDTLTALASDQRKTGPRASIDYSVQQAQVSPSLQAAQGCVYPALVADARAQAQKVAAAAGVTVHEIVGLSDGTVQAPVPTFAALIPVFSLGSVRSGVFVNPFGLSGFPAPSSSCSITVQFRISQ